MIVLKSIPIYPHNIPMFDGSPQELSHLETPNEASRASGADDFIKNWGPRDDVMFVGLWTPWTQTSPHKTQTST